MSGEHLTNRDIDGFIKAMVREYGARNQWNEADKSLYDGLLRGLVRIAHQEVLCTGLSVSSEVINVILDSRLGCLDKKDLETYTHDLHRLVSLAKEEKADEIRKDVIRAGFLDPLPAK